MCASAGFLKLCSGWSRVGVRDFCPQWWRKPECKIKRAEIKAKQVHLLGFIDSFFTLIFTCHTRVWDGNQTSHLTHMSSLRCVQVVPIHVRQICPGTKGRRSRQTTVNWNCGNTTLTTFYSTEVSRGDRIVRTVRHCEQNHADTSAMICWQGFDTEISLACLQTTYSSVTITYLSPDFQKDYLYLFEVQLGLYKKLALNRKCQHLNCIFVKVNKWKAIHSFHNGTFQLKPIWPVCLFVFTIKAIFALIQEQIIWLNFCK